MATTIIVNSGGDDFNLADSDITLREAIFQVSNDFAVDRVVDGGPYTIEITENITLAQSLPMIRGNLAVPLVINGNGHTIDGAGQFRVFFIESGTVTINDVVIANAVAQGGNGSEPRSAAAEAAGWAPARRCSLTRGGGDSCRRDCAGCRRAWRRRRRRWPASEPENGGGGGGGLGGDGGSSGFQGGGGGGGGYEGGGGGAGEWRRRWRW